MPTFRIDLEYDGAGFAGWAAQPGRRTVEGCLRRALEPLLAPDYGLAVAGRTDAGVHASGQVASVAGATVVDPDRLAEALRARLPEDISIGAVRRARDGFDARHDAVGRRYEYRVLGGSRSALRRDRVLVHPGRLDPDALAAAARATVGQHDFRAFTPTRTQHVFFDRTVTDCTWTVRGDELVLSIEADAFLRHMVRVLVGSQLLVGRGAWSPERYAGLLKGAPRGAAGPTAPAHALTLVGVTYDPPSRPHATRPDHQ